MLEQHRNSNSIGALLYEYEKALNDLDQLIANLTNVELCTIVDRGTSDLNCKSIQSILAHVISSGYNYVMEIRKSFGEDIDFINPKIFTSVKDYRL